ncbi:cysteine--tRNA ligase [Ranunculus cassubicifolius]
MAEIPELKIYNSATKKKETLKTKEPGKVGMYVCGVTAYDYSHVGHARCYIAFDLLHRYLKHLGYEVNYVRNFTDVDDKIIHRANELNKNPMELSGNFCNEFRRDITDLQCLPPTTEPRVSTHMDEIKNMIKQIISKKCTYTVDGDVYFSVEDFPAYGRLSDKKLEDNRAGERVAVDSRKNNAADFALWKAAKPGEPSWESPWGPGRPGWHIECSAMSSRYLTPSFDIHGGGSDLFFPHHENEYAQSCAACSDSNISYWMHNGFVNQNGEKMSKSLGNFFTIREVTKKYHPLALRYFLMSTHYRSPINYSVEHLETASHSVFYIYQTLWDSEEAVTVFREKIAKEGSDPKVEKITTDAQKCIKKLKTEFESRMSDDLHTRDILNGSLLDALHLMNNTLDKLKKKKQEEAKILNSINALEKEDTLNKLKKIEQQQAEMLNSINALEKEVKDVLKILGLFSRLTLSVDSETQKVTITQKEGNVTEEVLKELKEKALIRAGLTQEEVAVLIEERSQARNNKEYAKSDQIRRDLNAKGIDLLDSGKDTIWRPRSE